MTLNFLLKQISLSNVMGVWEEDESLRFINSPVVCPNTDCENRGQYTNCYDERVDNCYHYTLWKKRAVKR